MSLNSGGASQSSCLIYQLIRYSDESFPEQVVTIKNYRYRWEKPIELTDEDQRVKIDQFVTNMKNLLGRLTDEQMMRCLEQVGL